jgi:hypothetical protein
MEIVISFFAFVIIIIGMALGLLIQQKPLKGSCGGVARLMGKEDCDLCGGNPLKCDEQNNRLGPQAVSDLSYDASQNKAQ